MEDKIKSGAEIVSDFFEALPSLEKVDPKIGELLVNLYADGKLTDTNLKNGLQSLRETDDTKD